MLYEEFLYVEYLEYDSTAFFILDGVYFLGITYMADIPIELNDFLFCLMFPFWLYFCRHACCLTFKKLTIFRHECCVIF